MSEPSTATFSPEVVEFLSHGTRTGKLAYTASDGRPLIAPVWVLVEDGALVFTTAADTAKAKAIRRDPRVALAVDLEEPPYAFVQVQGVVELSEDPDELLRTATALGGRYMGADRAEEFGRRNGVPGELVVRVRPTKVIAMLDMTA
jgi:PPOX class probable F420-dependent enzyme